MRPNPSLNRTHCGACLRGPFSSNVEAVKKRFSRIPRWITQKINASKQRVRHDLAQGKGASTFEVTRILRIVWFFYSLVSPHNRPLRHAQTERLLMRPWERRLRDLAQLLRNCGETYFSPDLFRQNTNQFLQTSRTVTFIIQKNKADTPGFEAWYKTNVLQPWSNDPVMSWAKDARNVIEKRVSEFLCKRKLRVIAEGPDPQTRY